MVSWPEIHSDLLSLFSSFRHSCHRHVSFLVCFFIGVASFPVWSSDLCRSLFIDIGSQPINSLSPPACSLLAPYSLQCCHGFLFIHIQKQIIGTKPASVLMTGTCRSSCRLQRHCHSSAIAGNGVKFWSSGPVDSKNRNAIALTTSMLSRVLQKIQTPWMDHCCCRIDSAADASYLVNLVAACWGLFSTQHCITVVIPG